MSAVRNDAAHSTGRVRCAPLHDIRRLVGEVSVPKIADPLEELHQRRRNEIKLLLAAAASSQGVTPELDAEGMLSPEDLDFLLQTSEGRKELATWIRFFARAFRALDRFNEKADQGKAFSDSDRLQVYRAESDALAALKERVTAARSA